MNNVDFMPIGLGKDGHYRVRVSQSDVKNGIVFGKKTGFLEATTPEGYQSLQDGLTSNTLGVRWGAALNGGLTEAFPAEVAV